MHHDTLLFRTHVIGSGLRVLHQYRPLPWFACTLSVAAGERHDPPERPGTAHLLEHLISMGCEGYPRMDFTRLQQWAIRQGFSVEFGETNFDNAVYGGSTTPDRAEAFFRYLHAMLLRPRLDSDLEHEIEIIRNERTEEALSRIRKARRLRRRALFGDHPFARVGVWPEDPVLDSMTYDHVRSFHRALYGCPNMTLVVIGGITERSLLRLLDRVFVQDDDGFRPPSWPKPLAFLRRPRPHSRRFRQDDDTETESADIGYHWVLPPQNRSFIRLLCFCLQELMTDRVREHAQAAYGVSVDHDRHPDFTEVSITAEVPIANLGKTRRAIESALADDHAMVSWLRKVRREIVLNTRLADETVGDTLAYALENIVADGAVTTMEGLLRKYGRVRARDIVTLRRRHLSLRRAYVEIVEN